MTNIKIKFCTEVRIRAIFWIFSRRNDLRAFCPFEILKSEITAAKRTFSPVFSTITASNSYNDMSSTLSNIVFILFAYSIIIYQ